MRTQFLRIGVLFMLVGSGVLAQERTNTPPSSTAKTRTDQAVNEGEVCTDVTSYSVELNGPAKTNIAIKAGDQISFSASGSVAFGASAGIGDPNGIDGFDAYRILPTVRHGALIGLTDEKDGWFLIGQELVWRAQRDGILKFNVNDTEPQDNTGTFTVKMLVCRDWEWDISVKDYMAKSDKYQAHYLVDVVNNYFAVVIARANPGLADEIKNFFFKERPNLHPEGMTKFYAFISAVEGLAKEGKADLTKVKIRQLLQQLIVEKFPPSKYSGSHP